MITASPASSREWSFGPIPTEWRAMPLKYVCSRSSLYGANVATALYENEGVRFLRTTDIRDDGTLNEGGVFVPVDIVVDYILSEGDFLISRSGTVGRAYVYQPEDGLCAYAGYLVRYVLRDPDTSRWLFYITKSPGFRQWLAATAIEATIGNVNGEKYANILVPVPPLPQQRDIADYLDRETARLDALLAAKERVLGLLAEKRRALITRAVTRGLDPRAPLRDSGIPWLGEIPVHWEIWKLRHSASIGNGSTPSRGNAAYWTEGTIPWLNSSVVNQHEVTKADQFVTDVALRECHLPLVKSDSVLVAITGQGKTRGQAVVLSFDATINQHLAYVSPDHSRLDPWYLRWTLLSAYEFLRSISDDAGGTKGALTCEDVANVRVPVPPMDEQCAIVAHIANEISKLDELRTATEKTTTLLKERRAALIAAAVTGLIDVESTA